MKLRYIRTTRVGERIVSFLIDHFIFTAVFVAMIMTSLISKNQFANIFGLALVFFVPIVYGFKDIVDGRSIGKRAFSIGIRKSSNPDELPEKWRLFVRNLTLFIWPVEFLVMSFSQNGERLGDLLAGTIVVKLDNIPEDENSYLEEYHLNNESKPKESKNKIMKKVIIISVIFVAVIALFSSSITMMLKNSAAYEKSMEVIESSSEVYELVGDVEGYGFMPSGSLNTSNDSGNAEFRIKVKGSTGNCNAYIKLVKEPGEQWQVISKNYE